MPSDEARWIGPSCGLDISAQFVGSFWPPVVALPGVPPAEGAAAPSRRAGPGLGAQVGAQSQQCAGKSLTLWKLLLKILDALTLPALTLHARRTNKHGLVTPHWPGHPVVSAIGAINRHVIYWGLLKPSCYLLRAIKTVMSSIEGY